MTHKRPKLRCIASGTVYDVVGKLRRLTRQIDRGEHGELTDALVITRARGGEIRSYHYGTGNLTEAYRMANIAKDRLEI